MKKISFLILTLCLATQLFAQTEPANYGQALLLFKHSYNNNLPDSIFNHFSLEMKTALPVETFKSTTAQLKGQVGTLQQADFVKYEAPIAYYKATFQKGVFLLNISLNAKNQYTGLFLKPYVNDAPAATTATAAAQPQAYTSTIPTDPSITESPVTYKTFSSTISGTLDIPKNATGKVPVVLIIPGSGPTDRDGNSPKLGLASNAYKMIANELGKNGFASLRYDKRMVGLTTSSTKESDLRFEMYVDDAVGLINMLNDDQRFSKIIILGHSEGSLVGMMAAADQPIKAFISVAGAGDSADKIMTEQMKSQAGFISDGFNRMLDSLKRGKTTDNIDPSLYAVARPSIQKYLMSWFRYNPTREIRKIKMPVLIVQGTTDIQVTVADAEKLKKAKSEAILAIIPGMNHIMKDAPADKTQNMATYNQPELPLKPEFVTALIGFLNKFKRGGE